MPVTDFQLIIVGGGPAGLTAGLYAARARLNVVLLEKGAAGGQVMNTDWIENYPGFPEGITGLDLAEKFAAQAERFGLITKLCEVKSMDLAGPVKKIFLEGGETLTSQAVILATGARPNQLGIPGEKELTGKGVSYCATCDGPFYRGLEIAVIGGGDTAIQEAVHLTKFATRVIVIHRRDELRASKHLQEKAFANDKIEFIWDTVVTEVIGSKEVEGLRLQNVQSEEEAILAVKGCFVLVGIRPNMETLPLEQLDNDDGFIITDKEMRTSQPGVMAAGDICSKNVRQIVNATGEGAVACLAAENYLSSLN
ncbi:MAG: thioredoxin-disulfide reductase [Proteobacteria bacterium]|nr:thioredoxin-disulfide reductase [Pseudomonadota bacterium]MBU4294567.1 thioredoxin-disulfide reductase [Pseudomonadota bacterium]MCG2747103.1 thioredoxin-disulfide reductase [Desulfobulbaceae bacterium]